ncbi:ABC transporter ATP-binding protein [Rubidibacter lacunae]|uniref:ABC transporter ATP-binding protein n=1 Tax=Rubidibacter lacunae TaxID=582514 RepID=UPI000686BBF1|nr:ABC transporter ATP-binding protein [Rubidibacter lacunae]
MKLLGLLGLVLIGVGFETLGVGTIYPFIAALDHPSGIGDRPIIGGLYRQLGSPDPKYFLVGMGSVLIGIYIFKNIYLAWVYLLQNRFVYRKCANYTCLLFQKYIHSPYWLHIQRNPAQLLRNLTAEATLTAGAMKQILILATEISVAAVIACLLVIVQPVATFAAVVVLATVTGGIYAIVRGRFSSLGKKRQYHAGQLYQHANQGFGALKDIKVLSCESFFIERFSTHQRAICEILRWQKTISQFPRLSVETAAVTGLLAVIMVMILQGSNSANMLPTLSVFAAAAFRFMPSFNRIVNALNQLRFSAHAVDVIHYELQTLPTTLQASNPEVLPPIQVGIELHEVGFRYPGVNTDAIADISLTIPCGQSVGFVGASGAGKTTIVDLLLGLFEPTQGQVLVDGNDIRDRVRSWREQIGYVPQAIYLSDDTLRANIAFGELPENIDEEKVHLAVKSAQLDKFVSDLPDGLDTVVGDRGVRLSGGQRQRIGIARALYRDPQVLVLDEATAALDNQTEASVMEAVEQLRGERTIVVIAHRLSTVKRCDRLYFLAGGRIVDCGTYTELCQRNEQFQTLAQLSGVGGGE